MRKREESLPVKEDAQLRIFRGEEDNPVGCRLPLDSGGKDRRDWEEKEAFWAGRNHAGRISARLVA